MSEGLVSVIIPAYNREGVISDTLESVFRQTHRPLQVIVVDDGSTDGTVRAVTALAERKTKRGEFEVTCVSQDNAGAPAARNNGLSRSKGEFVQFLDSDDLIAPGKIEHQIGPLSRLPENTAVFGGWRRFAVKGKRILIYPPPLLPGPSSFLEDWLSGKFVPSQCFLWRRSDLEAAGPWDESLSRNQDGDFIMRFILGGGNAVFHAGGMSYYRYYLDASPRIVSDIGWKAMDSDFRVHERVEIALRERGILDEYRDVLAGAYYELAEDASLTSKEIMAKSLDKYRSLARTRRIPGSPAARLVRWTFGPAFKKKSGRFLRYKLGVQPFRPRGAVDSIEALYALDADA